jgi:hypothetical protein
LPLPTLDPRRRRKLPRNKKLLLPLLNLDLLRKVRVLLELRLRRMSRGLDGILLVIVGDWANNEIDVISTCSGWLVEAD